MKRLIQRTAMLAGVAGVALAMAACSSPKKSAPPVAAVSNTPPAATQTAPPVRTPEGPRSNNLPPPGPNNPGPVPGSAADFQVTAGDRVFFDYDSASIRGDAQSILDAQAAWLARFPSVSIRVDGNADERGTREYNFALGAERANSVKEYLVRKGVGAGRIETVSYGKERPIDPGENESAWARNRNGHTAITGGGR
jgi:peptidoglycan-associated lipoprotein